MYTEPEITILCIASVSHALLLLHTSGTSKVSAAISLLTVRMLHQIIAYYSHDYPILILTLINKGFLYYSISYAS